MTATLKRQYNSSSSDSSVSWARPKRGLPRRDRKVARISSSHCVASIPPALQQHRGKDASFSSSSDTELSSHETELGTALSENEIEYALPSGKGKADSEKSRSDGEMDLSSPCKEENQVEDDLGMRMSSSPSPPPVGWQWPAENSGGWGDEKGKTVDRREMGDVKRRRIEEPKMQIMEEEDEADDEMEDAEDAEDMVSTPRQKGKQRKLLIHPYIPSSRTVAPTPSIQRITDGFHGLTPYSMEMQISPDRPSFPSHSQKLSELFDPEEVDDALLASPSPGPSKKRFTKARPTTKRRSHEVSKRSSHGRPSASSTLRKLERSRRAPYAVDPFCHPTMTILLGFEEFPRPLVVEIPQQSSTWSYGPLSSPIRLATEAPKSPIRSRIQGIRTGPNKHLQRKSPTSLVPSRHQQRGRLVRSRAQPHARLSLPLLGPSTLVGQHVVSLVHQQKEARVKRRTACARQAAQVDLAALGSMRARAFESLASVPAFQNTLADIAKGCWWWAPAPAATPTVPSSRQLEAARSVEEVQVDCLVGNVARETEGDAAEVAALVTAADASPRASVRRPRPSSPEVVERARRAEAAQLRISVTTTQHSTSAALPQPPTSANHGRTSTRRARDPSAESSPPSSPSPDAAAQYEAIAYRSRTASRTAARREQEAEWSLSTERYAAAQRRQLGRQPLPLPDVPHRHVSALNPAWLDAVVIPPAPPAAVEEAEVVELEETDTESDSESGSVVSEPPAYDSASYPRHIPCPPNLRPRQPPTPVQVRLPSYAINRYSRRSPSPPPPYNAETDRQTLVAPMFIGEDDEDEEEEETAGEMVTVAVAVAEPRVIGAYPSMASVAGGAWGGARGQQQDRGRNRFDAALEMEGGEDADLIDELTSAYEVTRVGQGAGEGSVVGAIGGFLGRFFGRR